jgi:uncharacterized FAD-dependent dehydrogenase
MDIGLWNQITDEDLKFLERASDSNSRQVFDPAMIGVIVRTSRSQSIVQEYIPELVDNLDRMFTGITDNMLLYGLEAKFYANKPKFIDKYFQVKDNLYFAGDCSGVTRGIIQATAMGMWIGEQL